MEFIIKKIGMSRTLGSDSHAVTLVRILDSKVCELLDNGKAIVAYTRGKFLNKPVIGQQKKYNLTTEYNRFATISVNNKEIGNLDLTIFETATNVKVSMNTKGRGFSGVVKRWNFRGGPAAHGSRFHRAPGSIGNREWPGRVQKGKKMSGHYGNELVTTNNNIIHFDLDNSILVLKGSIPGHKGTFGRLKVIK